MPSTFSPLAKIKTPGSGLASMQPLLLPGNLSTRSAYFRRLGSDRLSALNVTVRVGIATFKEDHKQIEQPT